MRLHRHIIVFIFALFIGFSPAQGFSETLSSQKGLLVFLIGTSSAGKTTLCKKFSQINNNAICFEHDKLWTRKEIDFLSKNLGEEFDHFFSIYGTSLIEMSFRDRNCLHIAPIIEQCVEKDSLISLLNKIKYTLGPLRENFYNSTTQEIFSKIPDLIEKGKIVLIDKIIEQNDIELSFPYEPKCVVVYYPFEKLMERIEKRNRLAVEMADLYNYRHYLEAYQQYAHLYKATVRTEDELDVIEYDAVSDILKISFNLEPHYKNLEQFYLLDDKFDINDYAKKLTSSLEIIPSASAGIVSKFGCNLIIRSDELTSEEAAISLNNYCGSQISILNNKPVEK